ncbi:MAG: hypothetical protein KJO11_03705 [Gemmatimonadetes bacterium]|nr:hypothetical protein [Gemmatimonadota bacterium]
MSVLVDACDALESLLGGDARRRVVDMLAADASFARALDRLKVFMRRHAYPGDGGEVPMARWVARLDRDTAREGFRVMQSWDHVQQRFSRDDVPVMLTDYYDYLREGQDGGGTSFAILVDFHLLHLLALIAMRAWDDGQPDAILDRVEELLELLQGPLGSGHRFMDSAGMLLILAVSQYHPLDIAYDRLIDRIRGLDARHRIPFAQVSGGALGAHLRWGFSQMYRGDAERMREDNVGDYPWLLFSVATLMDAFASADPSAPTRREIGADLLNALSSDPGAFVGPPLKVFEPYRNEYERFRRQFVDARPELRALFDDLRPERDRFSPLSFSFNFPHNAIVAGTTVALLNEEPCAVPFDDLLLGGIDADSEDDPRVRQARALMRYAGARPERLEGRGNRLILYDAVLARESHDAVLTHLFENADSATPEER